MINLLLFFGIVAITAATPTITFYSDAACKTEGGGPPGLLSNPFEAPIGQCVKQLTSGYSIEAVSCTTGGSGTVKTFPSGCGSTVGEGQTTVQDGACLSSGGVNSITRCDGSGADGSESKRFFQTSAGKAVGAIIGVIGFIALLAVIRRKREQKANAKEAEDSAMQYQLEKA
jgi:hypothetical protein